MGLEAEEGEEEVGLSDEHAPLDTATTLVRERLPLRPRDALDTERHAGVYAVPGKNPAAGGERGAVSRVVVVGAVLAVLFLLLGGSAVLAAARDVPDRVADAVRGGATGGQSASQISGAEFLAVPRGTAAARVRALLGEPEHASKATVEGVDVECWAYGVAGATGAFQLCFRNGRLASRFRY